MKTTALALLGALCAGSDGVAALNINVLKKHVVTTRLHGLFSKADASSDASASKTSAPPCQCEADNAAWKAAPTAAQRAASCFFFDLGAGNGETYLAFLNKSTKWQFAYDTNPFADKNSCNTYLLEANPKFGNELNAIKQQQLAITQPSGLGDRVFPMAQKAIYMCDKAEENFYLDVTETGGPNAPGWGSSLDGNHASVKGDATKGTKLTPVKVQIVNLMRFLKETVRADDTVVVKMDIEGAEFDILPCLAKAPGIAGLIDTLYLENHCPTGSSANGAWCPSTGQAGNSKQVYDAAIATIAQAGVKMPQYWSPML